MVLHAADGIPQEPKVHTQPLLPPELFYSMVSLRKIPLLPPPAPPPSLPVAQFAFTPPFSFLQTWLRTRGCSGLVSQDSG